MKERSVDLTTFKKVQEEIIAANEQAWERYFSKNRSITHYVRDYKPEDIEKIISSGDINDQQELSRAFFERKGLYRHIRVY